jgi:hypothetical protein
MALLHTQVKEMPLSIRSPTSPYDPNHVLGLLGPHHENDSSWDRADREEALLSLGVGFIEEFEVVGARHEEATGLLEGDTVLLLIGGVLRLVPIESHLFIFTPIA